MAARRPDAVDATPRGAKRARSPGGPGGGGAAALDHLDPDLLDDFRSTKRYASFAMASSLAGMAVSGAPLGSPEGGGGGGGGGAPPSAAFASPMVCCLSAEASPAPPAPASGGGALALTPALRGAAAGASPAAAPPSRPRWPPPRLGGADAPHPMSPSDGPLDAPDLRRAALMRILMLKAGERAPAPAGAAAGAVPPLPQLAARGALAAGAPPRAGAAAQPHKAQF